MITDYASLLSAIKRWSQNDSLDAAAYDDFVQLTEAHVNSLLRCGRMSVTETQALTDGVAAYDLPADALGIRTMDLVTSRGRDALEYYTPEALVERYDVPGVTGTPVAYTLIGTQFELRPFPGEDLEVTFTYYQQIPPLTDVDTTNWLIGLAPMVYLYGGLAFLAYYVRDDEAAMAWETKLDREIAKLINSDAVDRWSGNSPAVRTL